MAVMSNKCLKGEKHIQGRTPNWSIFFSFSKYLQKLCP